MIRSHLWSDLTRREIGEARDAGALPVLPVGAVEQHADHLPVDCDSHSSFNAALAAATRCERPHVLVLPPPMFGFSPHHASWAGTITLRLSTFCAMVEDVVGCLAHQGFKRVLIVNGHGGNIGPLTSIVTALSTGGAEVGFINYWVAGEPEWRKLLRGQYQTVGHACEYETGVQLATRDDAGAKLIAERARNLPARLTQPYLRGANEDPISAAGGYWAPIFASDDCGYVGDPAASSRENGARLVDATVEALARFFGAFARVGLKAGTDRPV